MRLYDHETGFDLIHHMALNYQELLGKVGTIRLSKGDYVYQPGQSSTVVYELLNGVIKIGKYSGSGTEVPFEIIAPGDVFGNLNFLGGNHFFEYARTMTSCTIRTYPVQTFKELIMTDKVVAGWYNVNAIRRWCRLEARLFVICAESSRERLHWLEKNLDFEVEDNSGIIHHVLSILTQRDIASLLGLTRQTLASVTRTKKEKV